MNWVQTANCRFGKWKPTYIILLAVVCVGALGVFWVLPSARGQCAATAATWVAVLVAIGVADPRQLEADFSVLVTVDQQSGNTYEMRNVIPAIKQQLKEPRNRATKLDNWERVICTQRVYFSLTNRSGFELHEPTLTFVLPRKARHPYHEPANGVRPDQWNRYGFLSNLHNAQRQMSVFDVAKDRVAIANVLLPYWGDGVEWQVWVELDFEWAELTTFPVDIYLSGENVKGAQHRVTVTSLRLEAARQVLTAGPRSTPDG